MRTWTSVITTQAAREDIIDVLTDPEAANRWSPIPFEVEDLDSERLEAGSHARLTGSLAGLRVGFELEVHEADSDRLRLSAVGPIGIDVLYDLIPHEEETEVRASVSLRRGGGLTGRVLEKATDALLSAGALRHAVSRIAREAELCPAYC